MVIYWLFLPPAHDAYPVGVMKRHRIFFQNPVTYDWQWTRNALTVFTSEPVYVWQELALTLILAACHADDAKFIKSRPMAYLKQRPLIVWRHFLSKTNNFIFNRSSATSANSICDHYSKICSVQNIGRISLWPSLSIFYNVHFMADTDSFVALHSALNVLFQLAHLEMLSPKKLMNMVTCADEYSNDVACISGNKSPVVSVSPELLYYSCFIWWFNYANI